MTAAGLRSALLEAAGVDHAFGVRDAQPPDDLLRPKQVHGVAVAHVEGDALRPHEADAVVARDAGTAVGIVTADCVPILAASPGGASVAAIHAGWRGLAAGVIPAGIDALRNLAGDGPLRAAIGPHIGACCYEVDAPVIDALRARFGDATDPALTPVRDGHALLDLGALARADLLRAGLAEAAVDIVPNACTRCDADRFHSYRRDGPKAGRLVHHIRVRKPFQS